MNNKLIQLFAKKNKNLLNVYFTAGFPEIDSTSEVLLALQDCGVDIIEVGMPYSDPIADGPVIQQSNMVALQNGMTIDLLFTQLNEVKGKMNAPIILMGYLNPVMQYGLERFCIEASRAGVSGIILPDLPMREYEHMYKKYFLHNNLSFIFLITPQTSTDRILQADSLSSGFIYGVSSSATTGSTNISEDKQAYFKRIAALKLKNPLMIGFGIKDKETFGNACDFAAGAIVGSAYIQAIAKSDNIIKDTEAFIKSVR